MKKYSKKRTYKKRKVVKKTAYKKKNNMIYSIGKYIEAFPQKWLAIIPSSFNDSVFDPTAGNVPAVKQGYILNGLLDIDGVADVASPYLATLKRIYNKYRIVGIQQKYWLANSSASQMVFVAGVSNEEVVPPNINWAPSTVADVINHMDLPEYTTVQVGSETGKDIVQFKKYCNFSTYVGNKKQLMSDDGYQGLTGKTGSLSNPSNKIYLNSYVYTQDGAFIISTTGVGALNITVKTKYFIEFTERDDDDS